MESPILQKGQSPQTDNPPIYTLACWSGDASTETVVRSSRLTELDYEIALRHFVATSRASTRPN
jgi:hypothetical protein